MTWWWRLTGPHGALGWLFSVTGRWYAVGSSLGFNWIIPIGLFWLHKNCHQKGCWRPGKHMVNGSPWCDRHHEAARG